MGRQDACCLFWAALQHRACGWITEWKLGIQVNFILAFRSVQLLPQNVASNTCNAFAAVYLKICFSTSFGKPAGISTEMGFNSYPNSSWKWNWFQIFLSEMHLSQKNGSRGAFFLISSFLKGLTYSALQPYSTNLKMPRCSPTGPLLTYNFKSGVYAFR